MSDDVIDLFHNAEIPPMSIDPYAVVSGGQHRQRRRLVMSGVAAAAAVALAATVVTQAVDRLHAVDPLPAQTRTSTVTAAMVDRSQGSNAAAMPNHYEVTVDPVARSVVYVVVHDGVRTTLGSGSTANLRGGSTWVIPSAEPTTMIGLLPAEADTSSRPRILPPTSAQPLGLPFGTAELPLTGFQAFFMAFDSPSAARSVTALSWDDGRVGAGFSDGSAVQSARFAGPFGGAVVVYTNRAWSVLGTIASAQDLGNGPAQDGGSGSTTVPNPWPSAFVARGGPFGAVYGYLPGGARDVRLMVGPAPLEGIPVALNALSDGTSIALYAEEQGQTLRIDQVTAVSWVDPTTGDRMTTPVR